MIHFERAIAKESHGCIYIAVMECRGQRAWGMWHIGFLGGGGRLAIQHASGVKSAVKLPVYHDEERLKWLKLSSRKIHVCHV